RRAIRQVLSHVPGSTRSATFTSVSGVPAARAEARPAHGQAPRLRAPVLLREDAEAPLPVGRHPLSEGPAAAPGHPHPRGGRPPDRWGEESDRSDDAHGLVLDGHAERRAPPSAGPRHRQPAHADSHSARQGWTRPVRAPECDAAGDAPRVRPLDAAPKTWLFPGTIQNWRADKPITPKVVTLQPRLISMVRSCPSRFP